MSITKGSIVSDPKEVQEQVLGLAMLCISLCVTDNVQWLPLLHKPLHGTQNSVCSTWKARPQRLKLINTGCMGRVLPQHAGYEWLQTSAQMQGRYTHTDRPATNQPFTEEEGSTQGEQEKIRLRQM